MEIAAPWNIVIRQGGTYSERFQLRNEDNSIFDLTGYTALMYMKERKDSPNTLATLSTADRKIVLGGTDGTVDLLLNSLETAALDFKVGYYDLEIRKDGVVTSILEGFVTLIKEITAQSAEEEELADRLIGPIRMGAGALSDNYDYQKITLPWNVTVTKVYARSTRKPAAAAQIDIRNAENGGGEGVSVTFSETDFTASNVVDSLGITTDQQLVLRCVDAGESAPGEADGLSDLEITLHVTTS